MAHIDDPNPNATQTPWRVWWSKLERKTKYALIIGAVLALLLGLTSLSNPGGSLGNSGDRYANLPLQYGEIIPAESDCNTLQGIFDTAENAHDGRIEVGDVDMARAFTRTMEAADFRMREVGCYD